jgi:hypothetical protein
VKDPRDRVLVQIWGVFLASPLVQAFVLYSYLSTGAAPAATGLPPVVFQIAGGVTAIFALVVWRGALVPQNLRKAGTTEPQLRARWLTTHLLLFVIDESVALMGLLLGFLTGEAISAYVMLGTSAALIALMYPSRDSLDRALAEK